MTHSTRAPEPASLAHRNVAADPCEEAAWQAAAGEVCEPYCPASMGVEYVTLDGGDLDTAVCVANECENTTSLSGFVPVLATGEFGGDEAAEQWHRDGHRYACADCGRVFAGVTVLRDGEHVQVIDQLDTPPLAAAAR